MATITELLQSAIEHHRAGRLHLAEPLYRQILQSDPRHADALHLLGVLAQSAGHPEPAADLIGKAIAIDPSQASYHFNLGEIHRSQNHRDKARASYERALSLKPDHPGALNNLGTVLQEQGDSTAAETLFRRALVVRPDYAIALNNLGTVLLNRDELAEARRCLERALGLEADYPEAINGLGAVARKEGRTDEARDCFQRALSLRPGYTSALLNLGSLNHSNGKPAEALLCLREALRLKPDFAEAYYELGSVLKDGFQFSEAQAALEQALRIKPAHVDAWSLLATVFELQGRVAEARAAIDLALTITPSDALRIRAALILPVIYESLEEMNRERASIETSLARLSSAGLWIDDPSRGVGATAFFLAYQGRNDRDVLARLGAIYAGASPSLNYVAPHCRSDASGDRLDARLRVGFLSSFFYRHTVGKLNLGYVRNLTREQFEVFVLRPPGHDDAMSRSIEQAADRVVILPRELAKARQTIADLRLDILYYADIGMDPWTYFLGFSRLAPVQCVTWGHSVTSGIPSMDYYLSGDLMEAADADGHYTETLVRMRRVNTFYHEPALPVPAKTRADFGLGESDHLYVCTQSLYKMHPEFDAALGAILRADPKGVVVLLSGMHQNWSAILTGRFRRSIPDVADRIRFLAQQSQDDFLHLQALADVLLDTFHFGGCNTCYEAFAFGTPVVTLPGGFLRGRFTQAFYHQMGVLDCIARDPDDYARLAVRLASDPAWRSEVRSRILANKHQLYEDVETVRELEQFFLDAFARVCPGHTFASGPSSRVEPEG